MISFLMHALHIHGNGKMYPFGFSLCQFNNYLLDILCKSHHAGRKATVYIVQQNLDNHYYMRGYTRSCNASAHTTEACWLKN